MESGGIKSFGNVIRHSPEGEKGISIFDGVSLPFRHSFVSLTCVFQRGNNIDCHFNRILTIASISAL